MDKLAQYVKDNFSSLKRDKVLQQTFTGSTVKFDGFQNLVVIDSMVYETNLPARFVVGIELMYGLVFCFRQDIFTGERTDNYKPNDKVMKEFQSAAEKAVASFNKYGKLVELGKVVITGYSKPNILDKDKAIKEYHEAMLCCEGSEGERYKNTYACLEAGDTIVDDYAD